MNFQLLTTLGDDTREAVHSLLRHYNHAHNQEFFASRELEENRPKPLNVVAYDEAGVVAGGLISETQFLWLKVSLMAVAERSRLQGIGRRLLQVAEKEAFARGCRNAYLDSMDYQAPNFYEKAGYQIAGKLENWDSRGHARYLFTKVLSA